MDDAFASLDDFNELFDSTSTAFDSVSPDLLYSYNAIHSNPVITNPSGEAKNW